MLQTCRIYLKNPVVVAGARTPFVKSFGKLMRVDTVGLAVAATSGLLQKTKLNPSAIDHVIWGNVVMQTNAPNIARELSIDLNLPPSIPSHSTSMACLTGLNAIVQAHQLIQLGEADIIIAGGSESVSNGEMPVPRRLVYGLWQLRGKPSLAALRAFGKLAGWNPLRWLPSIPSVAERSTGKTMGWHGDKICELYGTPRAEQEAFARASHRNASRATREGLFENEIVAVSHMVRGKNVEVSTDDLIRNDMDEMEAKMQKMKPAFRKSSGATITAATSSALTDGASAVLVMSKEKAEALGYPTDVRILAHQYSAIDPYPQLLLAPAIAWPGALAKAGLTLKDIDFFELHEAFAGQVLTTLRCLANPAFCKRYMNLDKPVIGPEGIDMEKVNVNGGSIAIGHPFAATGGRVVTSAANHLRRTGKRHTLISVCAAGGLGGVVILEHTPRTTSKA